MELNIGYKCPHGHFKVQAMVGSGKCPQCGAELVPDADAPDSALNRTCRHCKSAFGFNLYDDGKCPKCGKPFD